MSTFALTELPSINTKVPSCKTQNLNESKQIVSREGEKLKNELNEMLNDLQERNYRRYQILNSRIERFINENRSTIQSFEKNYERMKKDMFEIHNDFEKLSTEISFFSVTIDANDAMFHQGIIKRVNRKLKDIQSQSDNLSKKLEIVNDNIKKRYDRAKKKILELNVQIKKKRIFFHIDYENVFLKYEKIRNFVFNTKQKIVPRLAQKNKLNISKKVLSEIDNAIENHKSTLKNAILKHSNHLNNSLEKLYQELNYVKNKDLNNDNFFRNIYESYEDEKLKEDQNEKQIQLIKNLCFNRLSDIEHRMNELFSFFENEIVGYKELYLNQIFGNDIANIQQLASDWETFHKNNVFFQKKVFDYINKFDDSTFNNNFFDRLSAAEKMMEYCIQRITELKEKTKEEIGYHINSSEILARLKILEEQVSQTEQRIKLIDKSFIPEINISKIEPCSPSLPYAEPLEPICLDPSLPLTYNESTNEKIEELTAEEEVNEIEAEENEEERKHEEEEEKKEEGTKKTKEEKNGNTVNSESRISQNNDTNSNENQNRNEKKIQINKSPKINHAVINNTMIKAKKKRISNKVYEVYHPIHRKKPKM